MNNKSRAQKALDDTHTLISNKINEIVAGLQAVPNLNRAKELTEWQRDAISEMPEELIGEDLTETLESQHNHWLLILGDKASSNLYPATSSAVGSNVSGSLRVYSTMYEYSSRNPGKEWPKIHIQGYHNIQKSQNVEGIVRSKLKAVKQIKPTKGKQRPISELFDVAMNAIEHARAMTDNMSAAGIEMRTVLEQFKGTLYYKSSAFKSRGSDEYRWEKMAVFLAKNGAGSSEHAALVKEFKTHDQFQSDLSELAKRKKETAFDISYFDSLVVKFLDHLEAVLNFIDLDKLS
jgi:hypothetical protein